VYNGMVGSGIEGRERRGAIARAPGREGGGEKGAIARVRKRARYSAAVGGERYSAAVGARYSAAVGGGRREMARGAIVSRAK